MTGRWLLDDSLDQYDGVEPFADPPEMPRAQASSAVDGDQRAHQATLAACDDRVAARDGDGVTLELRQLGFGGEQFARPPQRAACERQVRSQRGVGRGLQRVQRGVGARRPR